MDQDEDSLISEGKGGGGGGGEPNKTQHNKKEGM